jgi:hypothetical protein
MGLFPRILMGIGLLFGCGGIVVLCVEPLFGCGLPGIFSDFMLPLRRFVTA